MITTPALHTAIDRRLVLTSDLSELDRLSRWIADIVDPKALAGDLSFALQLCLEEAVANIIMYGARDRHDEIAVEVNCSDAEVVAIIEDSGREFDPTKVPPPAKPTSLEEAEVGRVGIHLMRSFAHQMSYELREGRNRLTLRFVHGGGNSKETT